MTTLIERQHVRRRVSRAPILLPPPLTQEQPIRTARRRRFALFAARRKSVTAASVALIAIAIIVVIALSTRGIHGASIPRGGLALPSDHTLAAALSSYGGSTPVAPNVTPPQAPPVKVLPVPAVQSYRVRAGDTIAGIAQAFHVSDETVISYNRIEDVRRIVPGTTLKVPNMNGVLYQVQRGDSLGGISKSYSIALSAILDANNLKSSTIYPGQQLFLPGAHMSTFDYRKALGRLFIFPTSGMITSGFGMRHDPFTGIVTFHNGIDIANGVGTPVRAAMDGRVAYIGENRGYGRFILIDHGGGFQTLYGHLYKWLVERGVSVRAGQEIGLMGDTGYSTGPHLHFTIYKNSVPVNPLIYLTSR